MHYPVPGFGADRRHESHKRRVRSLPSSPKRSVQKGARKGCLLSNEPHRSRTARVQTPRPRRGERRSCQRDPDRREPQRCRATAVAGRRDSVDSRHARADRFASPRSSTPIVATIPTRIAADFASATSDRSSPGTAPNTTAAWANSAGRRTDSLVAPWLPPASHSLRTPIRHSRSIPKTSLFTRLLEQLQPD